MARVAPAHRYTVCEARAAVLRTVAPGGVGARLASGRLGPLLPDSDGRPISATQVGRPVQLLPVNNQSATTWNPNPSDLPYAANVSLSSIGKGWTTSEVRAMGLGFGLS